MKRKAWPLLLLGGAVSLLLLLSPAAAAQETTTTTANDTFLAGFNGPFPTITGHAGTEISSTVSLLYQEDWDVSYIGKSQEDWSSKCIDMLNRANEYKASAGPCCWLVGHGPLSLLLCWLAVVWPWHAELLPCVWWWCWCTQAKVVNFMVTHYWVDDNFDGKVGLHGLCVLGCAGLFPACMPVLG